MTNGKARLLLSDGGNGGQDLVGQAFQDLVYWPKEEDEEAFSAWLGGQDPRERPNISQLV